MIRNFFASYTEDFGKNFGSRKFFKNLVRDRTFSRGGGTRSTFSDLKAERCFKIVTGTSFRLQNRSQNDVPARFASTTALSRSYPKLSIINLHISLNVEEYC